VAVLSIDALEGVRDNPRHGYLLHLLAAKHSRSCQQDAASISAPIASRDHRRDFPRHLIGLGVHADILPPISARDGDASPNTRRGSLVMGPETVVEALDSPEPRGRWANRTALPVQACYKFDDRRIVCGSDDLAIVKGRALPGLR